MGTGFAAGAACRSIRAGSAVNFRFASLGSGSRGNATLVEAGSTRVLVDCGFPAREFVARCDALAFDPCSLDALLVTHEHGDHMRGIGAVARRFGVPVWMTHGTWRARDYGTIAQLNLFGGHAGAFRIGQLEIMPVPVPHDACEPTQYVFSHDGHRFGLLTDLGSITPRIVEAFSDLDALLLECNHDTAMLANGPYPMSLQARVGGQFGHLNNAQAAGFLAAIDQPRLQHLVAGHLSEKNNCPDLARASLEAVMVDGAPDLALLIQDRASEWFSISA
jgi:phosphoribosyl 1,2-cyclic phosphodiesterase